MHGANQEGMYAEIVRRTRVGVTIWNLDDDGRTLRLASFNPAASEILNIDLEGGIGRSLVEIFPLARDRVEMHAAIARSGEARVLGRVNYIDSSDRERTASAHAIGLAGRKLAVLFEDVTEQLEAEASLRESEERFRTLCENSADSITITDAQGVIQFISASVKEVNGYTAEELSQINAFDFVHPEDLEKAIGVRMNAMSNPTVPFTETVRVRHRDGSFRHVEVVTINRLDDPRIRGVVTIFRDVTARVLSEEALTRAEKQLLQAQKMEAIGKLAGGVAHDFNNLLSVILGISSLLLEKIGPDSPMHSELAEIKHSGERAARLTNQLLAFSRQQMLDPRVLDLNDIISNIDRMLRRIVGEDIDLRAHLSPGLLRVRVDPSQIEQVIMNLVVNARDAMPKGGALTIETANVELDSVYAAEHVGVTPGPHVLLAITDTGTGMDRATQVRVYEPFFTTKGIGKGTGLGLSTVFGIVKQSGGTISLSSEIGKGTTFKIYLPAAPDSVAPARVASVAPASRGTETILLVEDDVTVRAVVKAILGSRGYHVVETTDVAHALAIGRDYPEPIHLLLTDVVMPKMSGRELAEQIKALRPSIKVLYMSGYTDNTIVHHGVVDEGIAFLPKPITPSALTHKVREVLDADR